MGILPIQAVIYKLSQPLVYIFRQILLSFYRFKEGRKKGTEILNNTQSNKDAVTINSRNPSLSDM